MRTLVCLFLVCCVLTLSWHAISARAEGEGDPAVRLNALEAQNKVLRAEVNYLLAREATLTKWTLGMNTLQVNLNTNLGAARAQGFESAAISAPSRVAVLKAIDQMGHDLMDKLPVPTSAEQQMRKVADDLRREYGR
jgi:hypothetical protein